MNLTAVKVHQECLAQEFFRDLPMSLPRDLRQLLSKPGGALCAIILVPAPIGTR